MFCYEFYQSFGYIVPLAFLKLPMEMRSDVKKELVQFDMAELFSGTSLMHREKDDEGFDKDEIHWDWYRIALEEKDKDVDNIADLIYKNIFENENFESPVYIDDDTAGPKIKGDYFWF